MCIVQSCLMSFLALLLEYGAPEEDELKEQKPFALKDELLSEWLHLDMNLCYKFISGPQTHLNLSLKCLSEAHSLSFSLLFLISHHI